MLDLLCDAVEVEDYKASKQKELRIMNKIMDERQRKRDAKAETHKMQKITREVDNCVEEFSSIILKERTRRVSKEELEQKVTKRRQFLGLDKIE